MKVFSWIHKWTSSGEEEVDKTPLPVKDYPEGLTPLEGYLFKKLQSGCGSTYGYLILDTQEMWKAGFSSEFDKLNGVSWKGRYGYISATRGLELSNDLSYDHLQKVGDCYYMDNEGILGASRLGLFKMPWGKGYTQHNYIGKCAYELLTLFLNNPRRFKIVEEGLLDRVTGKVLNKDYDYCGMTTKVTLTEWDVVSAHVEKYYGERAEKLKGIKLVRKEREMLSLYCKCESDV